MVYLTSKSINKEMEKSVEKTSSILTDGCTGYSKLKEVINHHQVLIEPNKKKSTIIFPWVNRTISNDKKVLLGIHNDCINQQYMQNYLDEFCYKFNRRCFCNKLSDRLMITALKNNLLLVTESPFLYG